MKNKYCYNGDFYESDTTLFGTENRALRYGDSLFETMPAVNMNIHLLTEHIERLKGGMRAMKMNVPLWFDADFFENKISRLLKKNKLFKGARIRLSVFRNDGGLYTPTDNDISYFIEAEQTEQTSYTINKGNYSVDIFEDMRKDYDCLSRFKTGNSAIYIMAGLWRKENNLDDCLIINTDNKICESMSSNLFIVKKDTIFTPPVSSGCVEGVMRNFIIRLLQENNIPLEENGNITVKDLCEADELFLTNSVCGIRKVLSFRDKRYYSFKSRNLIQLIDRKLTI